MKRIDAIIRPEKLQLVIQSLRKVGVTGFTVIPVQGRGQQKNATGVYRGTKYDISLHPKIKLEIVVSDQYIQPAVQAIIDSAQTGETGDGKIFVYNILEAYNIRTGQVDETIDELNN
ncbi:P-II family nitrogen regulator [Alicyclobacillus tolerans]|uniref:P-II family nitrogen regulator n=1 Tax=Alicyclobacillus tolerans TaxID=90970 RepID=UPI001F2888C0|nr:P-II family nitrogen regulator [Alicyclobacillus tolerans]MCF8564109.1 P-II family nitrogen regulator [Alicyclobacillus tolerans]